MDPISNEDDRNSSAEELFGSDVHFSGGSSLQICFPPLRMKFNKDFKCEDTIGKFPLRLCSQCYSVKVNLV